MRPVPPGQRLGVSFHRTFALRRPGITQILALGSNEGAKGLDSAGVWAQTALGTVDAQASCRYAYGVGLLDSRNRLTQFGALVARQDASLQSLATQWAMHYHISSPHRGGPAFWAHLVAALFSPGTRFGPDRLAEEIGRCVSERGERALAERTLRSAATVFAGTYTKPDSLGPLGILARCDSQSDDLCVQTPVVCGWPVLAYALAEYWDAVLGGQKTVSLGDLITPGTPGAVLLLGSEELSILLRQMQNRGLVQVHRQYRPYQVERLWRDVSSVLELLYEDPNAE